MTLDFFPRSLGAVSDKQGKRLRENILLLERRHINRKLQEAIFVGAFAVKHQRKLKKKKYKIHITNIHYKIVLMYLNYQLINFLLEFYVKKKIY